MLISKQRQHHSDPYAYISLLTNTLLFKIPYDTAEFSHCLAKFVGGNSNGTHLIRQHTDRANQQLLSYI